MPTKKCHLCGRAQQIDELDLTCPNCLEKELDILMAVYGFIHCFGSDYCPAGTIIRDLEPIRGTNVSHIFMKNWIRKGWLEANEVNSVRVPPPIGDQLKEQKPHETNASWLSPNRTCRTPTRGMSTGWRPSTGAAAEDGNSYYLTQVRDPLEEVSSFSRQTSPHAPRDM